VAHSREVTGVDAVDEQLFHEVDVSGQHIGEQCLSLRCQPDQDHPIIGLASLSGDQTTSFEQRRLVGESTLGDHEASCQLAHSDTTGVWPQLGEDGELHFGQVKGPELFGYGSL